MTSIFDEAYDATITDLAERGVGRAFPAPLVQPEAAGPARVSRPLYRCDDCQDFTREPGGKCRDCSHPRAFVQCPKCLSEVQDLYGGECSRCGIERGRE